jgi:hypothetical protein
VGRAHGPVVEFSAAIKLRLRQNNPSQGQGNAVPLQHQITKVFVLIAFENNTSQK